MNFLSAETAEARVSWRRRPPGRACRRGIVVELIAPSDSFWGVNLQIKKTSVELQKLEDFLRSEGIDLRLLKEYRDAVDYIRAGAQAVQQLRERQLQGRSSDDVLSALAAERIRRATNICFEVISDVDSGRVSSETKGAGELYRCLAQTYERLGEILQRRKSGKASWARPSLRP